MAVDKLSPITPSHWNSSPSVKSVNEEFCIHGDRTIVCIEMRSINERGGDKNTHTHTYTRFSLCFWFARKHKHSHVTVEFAPSLTECAHSSALVHLHAHTFSGLQKSSSTQLSTLKTLLKGTQTQSNTVFFLLYIFSVSAKEGGSDRTLPFLLLPLQMGITCARVTLPHFSLHWLSDPLRPKHAGANKRFGLCGPDKRGFVFSGDFNVSV